VDTHGYRDTVSVRFLVIKIDWILKLEILLWMLFIVSLEVTVVAMSN